jgi:hypothetical protein
MKTARILIALAVLAVLACAIPATAAAPVITAQYDYFAASGSSWTESFSDNSIIAQTFVPTISGRLTSINATVHTSYGGNPQGIPISFEIRSVWNSGANGMQPDRRAGVAPLSTGSVSASDPLINDMFIKWANVSMTPCELQAGQMYAIVVSALGTSSAYEWYSKGDNTAYPAGRELVGNNGDTVLAQQSCDLSFRVNVVPEPGSLLALGSGLMGLLGLRFRRK